MIIESLLYSYRGGGRQYNDITFNITIVDSIRSGKRNKEEGRALNRARVGRVFLIEMCSTDNNKINNKSIKKPREVRLID